MRYLNHWEHEALVRLISAEVCAPFNFIEYKVRQGGVRWKIKVKKSHSSEVLEGTTLFSALHTKVTQMEKEYCRDLRW